MKITKSQLREIIKEEIQLLSEKNPPKTGTRDYHIHSIAVSVLKTNDNSRRDMNLKQAEDILRNNFDYSDGDIKKLKDFPNRPPTDTDADKFIKNVLKVGLKTRENIFNKWMSEEGFNTKLHSNKFIELVADRIKTKWT
jgi:hypothetical protein